MTDEFQDEGENLAGGASPLVDDPLPAATGSANPFSKRARLRRAWQVLRGKDVEELTSDPDTSIRQARAHQDNRWRGVYALVLLVAMVAQVAFADVIFWLFLVQNDWEIDSAIFLAFFGSVVVEVIGLVLVVTQSLFPGDKKAGAATGSAEPSS